MALDIITTILFIIFLVLELKQNIWCWPISVIASSIYLYTQIQEKMYGICALSIFLIISGLWAWYHWNKQSLHPQEESTHYTTSAEWIKYGCITVLLEIISYALLSHFNSSQPLLESIIFTLNIVGTLLIGKKSMGAWIVFGIGNALSILMFAITSQYIFSGLYVVYLCACFVGWFHWRKIIPTTHHE